MASKISHALQLALPQNCLTCDYTTNTQQSTKPSVILVTSLIGSELFRIDIVANKTCNKSWASEQLVIGINCHMAVLMAND